MRCGDGGKNAIGTNAHKNNRDCYFFSVFFSPPTEERSEYIKV